MSAPNRTLFVRRPRELDLSPSEVTRLDEIRLRAVGTNLFGLDPDFRLRPVSRPSKVGPIITLAIMSAAALALGYLLPG